MIKKNKKYKWLIIVSRDAAGGAEQNQSNLADYISSIGEGCFILLITKKLDGRWEFLKEKCTVKYFPTNSIFIGYILLAPYLFLFLIRNKVKYIFTSQTLINALIGFLKRFKMITYPKVIVRESNSIFELMQGRKLERYRFAYNLGYLGVDLIICQTQYMKNSLTNNLEWLQKLKHIVVIPNPININFIKKMESEVIDGLNKKKYIVAAGRLVDAKGFDILIDAYNKAKNELENHKLFILGEGRNRGLLEKQINRLNLNEHVKLLGVVPNVYPYFKNAKLCVLSSRIEGFPNVLLQMMSQNEKVVSTISAGGIERIPNIFTCPIENSLKLQESIINCLKANTSGNRKVFDSLLNERDLSNFYNSILTSLEYAKTKNN